MYDRLVLVINDEAARIVSRWAALHDQTVEEAAEELIFVGADHRNDPVFDSQQRRDPQPGEVLVGQCGGGCGRLDPAGPWLCGECYAKRRYILGGKHVDNA